MMQSQSLGFRALMLKVKSEKLKIPGLIDKPAKIIPGITFRASLTQRRKVDAETAKKYLVVKFSINFFNILRTVLF